ncbi:carbohydrate ABC transporter permease [Thermocatellispora tengchongensis]|uniref:carbohydrate ABC transporter permease n=1 Tax=Thermocatellispora tengchongensis TaxID=1073253 RepID=UPI00362790E2
MPQDNRALRLTWRLLTAATGLAIALAMLFPLVWMVATSFKPEPEIVSFPPRLLPETFTLDNYIGVWERLPFTRLFLNTVVFAGAVTVCSLLLDSMTAYALARLRFRGKGQSSSWSWCCSWCPSRSRSSRCTTCWPASGGSTPSRASSCRG